MTHRAIERQFTDDERARKIGAELLGRHHQADGNRQIVRGTFFAKIGGRKVDGYQSGTIGGFRPAQLTP